LPETLKREPQEFLAQRFQDTTLKWRVWYAFRDPRKSEGELQFLGGRPEIGDIDELVRAILAVEAEVYDLENAVDVLQKGAREAGATLGGATLGSLAKNVFKDKNYKTSDDAEDTASLSALIVINAMMFQERLGLKKEEIKKLKPQAREVPRLSKPKGDSDSWKQTFSDAWELIIDDIDYYAIFKMALDVVETIHGTEIIEFLSVSMARAKTLVELTKAGSHDLSGRIFNKLVADRDFVKAYYTRIPTATLLAGLALAPQRWKGLDWTDAPTLNKFRIVDPACGTGTLLMAAYKQIEANAKIAELKDPQKRREFHKTMVETAIYGFDVVHVAIHLAAATLASVAPEAIFDKGMHLYVPKFGIEKIEKDEAAYLGSLDFLDSDTAETDFSAVQSKFEQMGEKVGAHSQEEGIADIPHADLIIANPPYSRDESNSGTGELKSRVFGQFTEDWPVLSKHLSKKLQGTSANRDAGLAAAFIVLANHYVKPNRRIAFVLPSTFLTGTSWADLRRQIADIYDVEFVVSAQVDKSQSLSFDTGITEVLLIARKLASGETPPRQAIFVNLSSLPADAYEANLLVREINKIADPNEIRKISEAPVSGTPIGGEFVDKQWNESSKWGEAVVAPIDGGVWGSAVWQYGVTGQYVWNVYDKGMLWNIDGTRLITKFELTNLSDVANVGPHHRAIKANNAPFKIYKTYDIHDQFPAMLKLKSKLVKSMQSAPNAHLLPKPDSNYERIWKSAGHLQVAPELRYGSQSQGAVFTERKTIGVRSWFTLTFKDDAKADAYEKVMALWLNSTLGLCCQIAHSTFSQFGRGTIGKTGLLSLPVLDVTKLNHGELNAAQKIWDDLKDAEFKSFLRCNLDETRIELDNRLLKGVFGLGADALEAVARIRELLVQEPRVHGGRKQSQPKTDDEEDINS